MQIIGSYVFTARALEFFSYPKMVSIFLFISKPISSRIRSRRTHTTWERGTQCTFPYFYLRGFIQPQGKRGRKDTCSRVPRGKRGICTSMRIGRGGGPGCVRGGYFPSASLEKKGRWCGLLACFALEGKRLLCFAVHIVGGYAKTHKWRTEQAGKSAFFWWRCCAGLGWGRVLLPTLS